MHLLLQKRSIPVAFSLANRAILFLGRNSCNKVLDYEHADASLHSFFAKVNATDQRAFLWRYDVVNGSRLGNV